MIRPTHYFTLLFTLLFCQLNTIAQQNYGTQPELCKEKLSILVTYYKQKAYKEAAPSLRWLLNNSPEASKNIYIIGNKVYETLIKEASADDLKKGYVDSLLLLQDWRMKYFPQNNINQIRVDKAIYLLKYRLKDEYPKAFSLLDSSFQAAPQEFSPYELYMYMYCYKIMVKSNKKNCTDMIPAYLKTSLLLSDKEKAGRKVPGKTKNKINEYAEVCLNCTLMDSIYLAEFSTHKTDTLWLDNGIALFSAKKCKTSSALLLLMEERFSSKKDAKTASSLGKYFLGTQEFEKAILYINEAISMEKDSTKLANHYNLKANYYIAIKNFVSAKNSASKASTIDPSNFKSYILCGDAIAYSTGNCTSLTFGGNELYWLAVDYYVTALSKADTEKERIVANNKIARYQNYFPLEKDLFMKSLKNGDSYKIECSFNRNTKVRSRK